MRFIAFLIAALVISAPAGAQEWKEYAYPSLSFSVAFPEEPTIETLTYQTADGTMVEARVYMVARGNSILKMTVADLSGLDTEEKTVIDHAIRTLSQGGEIKVDIPHRIRRTYGRQLSITGADGSHSSVAVFYYQRRLYQIEGIALPLGADATADAIRFQQSLSFTNNAANRSRLEPVYQVLGHLFGNP